MTSQRRPAEIQSALTRHGWVWVRTAGSHRIFKHASNPLLVTLPWHQARPVKHGILRQILKVAGVTEAEFFG